MKLFIITLFPEIFSALDIGITGRALKKNLIELTYLNLRDFADNEYRRIDDRPYGGGPGMVMMVNPLSKAIHHAKQQAPENTPVIYLSPQGKTLQQSAVETLKAYPSLILLCGRYEGIDERIMPLIDQEWSIGDYILTGGELAAMVLIDAMTRLLPGALGDENSALYESFSTGLLDHPHYTRPEISENSAVPPVLLQGNHDRIRSFRLQQALGRTWIKRPDLLNQRQLTVEEKILLDDYIASHSKLNKTQE